MDNIFENAYFGKAYKTRDGRKAKKCVRGTHIFFTFALQTNNEKICSS